MSDRVALNEQTGESEQEPGGRSRAALPLQTIMKECRLEMQSIRGRSWVCACDRF